jgi:hypothetical protein
MTKLISPIINYFLANNMCKAYTDIEGERSTTINLNFPNTGNYQESYYMLSNSTLDGQNCTITGIEIVNSTELTRNANGQIPLDASQFRFGVLYISNLDRTIIAELPLYSLVRTNNNGKLKFTYFNTQLWQNCYVQFTASSFTTTITPLVLRVYYVPKVHS